MFTPSAYQQAVFDWVEHGEGHAFVDAAAGSGKSTTLVQAAALLQREQKHSFVLITDISRWNLMRNSRRQVPQWNAERSIAWGEVHLLVV